MEKDLNLKRIPVKSVSSISELGILIMRVVYDFSFGHQLYGSHSWHGPGKNGVFFDFSGIGDKFEQLFLLGIFVLAHSVPLLVKVLPPGHSANRQNYHENCDLPLALQKAEQLRRGE